MAMQSLRSGRRPLLAVAAAVFLCLPFGGCDGPTSPESAASTLVLGDSTLTLVETRSDTLSATVLTTRGRPLERVRPRWSSADTTIAVVDSAGVVTARQMGATRIVAALRRPDGTVLADSAVVVVRARPDRVTALTFHPATGRLSAGEAVREPVPFLVSDRFGNGVPGIEVGFRMDGGELSASSATTDSLGRVTVYITRVPPPGNHRVEARIEGFVPSVPEGFVNVVVDPPLRVVLSPDSVVIPGPGCSAPSVTARLYAPDGQEVTFRAPVFSVLDTTVAQVRFPIFRRGQYADQVMEVEGRRAGATSLVASLGGTADTIPVRVLQDQVKSFSLHHGYDRGELPLGDTVRLAPTAVFAACDATVRVPGTSLRSGDERVATVSPDGVVTGRGVGTTRIEGSWRGLDATLTLTVRDYRLTPADTVVTAGDTIRHRLRATGAQGVAESIPIFLAEAIDGPAVRSVRLPDQTLGIVAAEPGEAVVSFRTGSSQILNSDVRRFTGRVMVVPRPGS